MKTIASIFLTLLFAVATAQNQKQDAVFEKIVKEYTLNDDGSIDFHYYKKLKLLTHFSFNRLYGETFIVYNPLQQKLKINLSRTIQQDGNVIETPANAFNEVLPRSAVNAPYYNYMREMVVTHTGLEVNAVIELDYTLHSNPGYFPALMGYETVRESSPVEKEVIIINIPAEQDLNYNVFNTRTSPEIKVSGGKKTYTFTFTGLSGRPHENFRMTNSSDEPGIVFSTVDMEQVYRYLINQQAFAFKTCKSMDEVIAERTENADSDLQKILNLQKTVVNDLNLYGINQKYPAWKIRTPVEVWKSNGGTEFEKSVLLTAMLRKAGINANPVMLINKRFYNEANGCLPLVAGFAVQVNPRETQQLYLPVTRLPKQNMIYELDGYAVIALVKDKPLRREKTGEAVNELSLKTDLVFDDSLNISGNATLRLTGRLNPYFELFADPAKAKRLLRNITVADYKLTGLSQQETEAVYTVADSSQKEKKGGYYFFKLPVCNAGSRNFHIRYLTAKRGTTLELPYALNESYETTITLPAGARVVNTVETITSSGPAGNISIEITQTGNKVTVKKVLTITHKIIPVSEYAAFKEMMDLWNGNNVNKLIIKL